MADRVRLCRTEDIAPGTTVKVEAGGLELVL
jgi:hypothetical protein